MNPNIILAILERKGIITQDEALATAEHVANNPQSTYYGDAQEAVRGFITPADKDELATSKVKAALDRHKPAKTEEKSEEVKNSADKKA
jgi:hypothetical protein